MTTKTPKLTIICVCPGIGFPVGQANTNRICYIGRTIVEGGGRFRVWHFGTSPNKLNQIRKGIWNGIEFEYLCGRVSRPKNKLVRMLVNAVGVVHLFFKLFFFVTGRKNTYVFFDLQGTAANVFLTPFCRLLRIKTVQEVNEWWPEVAKSPLLVKFQYKKIMFRFSNGSFLISKDYRDKVLRTTDVNPRHKFFYLPIVAEPLPLRNGSAKLHPDYPFVFWCGMVDGYLKDVLFIVQAFARVQQKHPGLKLVISGKHSSEAKETIEAELTACNIPPSRLKLTGFISDEELESYVSCATVLVAPMWEDERSGMRFPTKLGMYAASGRGIVTAPVGELKEYFTDGVNCLFYEAGSVTSLAEKIGQLVENRELAEKLGKNARLLADTTFSYKNYVDSMQEFFRSL